MEEPFSFSSSIDIIDFYIKDLDSYSLLFLQQSFNLAFNTSSSNFYTNDSHLQKWIEITKKALKNDIPPPPPADVKRQRTQTNFYKP